MGLAQRSMVGRSLSRPARRARYRRYPQRRQPGRQLPPRRQRFLLGRRTRDDWQELAAARRQHFARRRRCNEHSLLREQPGRLGAHHKHCLGLDTIDHSHGRTVLLPPPLAAG